MRKRHLISSSDPVPRRHQSVLLHEALRNLDIQPNDIVVDATLGSAGHARAIAHKLGLTGKLIGIDADAAAIERSKTALKDFHNTQILLIEDNFRNLDLILRTAKCTRITKALFDLGWSSEQLGAGRGFSFQKEEPLLMTFSSNQKANQLTAEKIVNEWEEQSIADVIYGWGEERYAKRIARAIVAHRVHAPFKTAAELAEVIRGSVPVRERFKKLHPATRTFQALRIAVNDELGALREGLTSAWRHLAVHGRIAVISFHSIEDREVKRAFAAWEKDGDARRITRRPITPSTEEIVENPRSHSAKLRVIEKTYTKP